MKIAVAYESGQIFQHFGHTDSSSFMKLRTAKSPIRKLLIPTAAVTAHWQVS